MQLISKDIKYKQVKRFQNGKPIKVDKSLLQHTDPRLLNPSESTRINSPYIKEKALKPTQKVDPERFEIESMVPFIGDAADINNVSSDFSSGNYGAAALGAGLLLLPNVIEKPLKVAGKAIKQGVKKYGTKAANKVENIAPKASDWFHTWNAKDNIKHATFDDVVNAKKSRLEYNKPTYTDADRKAVAEQFGMPIDSDWMRESMPTPFTRHMRLHSPIPQATPTEFILGFKEAYPKTYYSLGPENVWKRFGNDIRYSRTDLSNIHLGTKEFDPSLRLGDAGYFDGKPVSPFRLGSVYSHELDHYIGIPNKEGAEKLSELFKLKDVPDPTYYTQGNMTDIKARLGQFKDLFLLTGNNPISSSQARVAAKMHLNPTKYGLQTNMLELKGDFDKMDYKKLSSLMNQLSLKHGGEIKRRIRKAV